MTEAEKICIEIQQAMPEIVPGGLRFWGAWYGRPYDLLHRIVAAEHDHDILRLRFNKGEKLTIWSPAHLELGS